jgi:hypothetical protein
MYILGRSRTIAPGHARAALGASVEAATRFSQVTGLKAYAWTALFSPGAGTVVWSARAEHLQDLADAAEKWAADGPTMDWVEQTAHLYEGPTNDALAQLVHGTPAPEPGPVVGFVQAQWAPAKAAEAMGLGGEIADAFTALTGVPAMFLAAVTGPFAGVSWMSNFSSLAQAEEADAKSSADAGWLELMERAGTCYQPGATSIFLRRLA